MNSDTRFSLPFRNHFLSAAIIAAVLTIHPALAATETEPPLPAMKPSGNPGAKPAKVPTEKDFGAYLFAFHKDDDHSLHFALSPDGYTFTDVPRPLPPFVPGRLR